MTSSRLATLLWFAGAASAGELRLYEAVEPHLGTLVGIKLYTDAEDRAKAAFRAAFDRIAEVDRALSDYQEASELNRVCREAVGRPLPASEDLFRVLAASQKMAEETDGAFDVTLGPVIRLWRVAKRERRLPSEQALREARERSGYRKLHLEETGRTVMLDQAGMQLDAGGIGKGYAADAALEVLAGMGIRRALVAASGDLAFGDAPPDRPGWRIGLGANAAQVMELENAAVSTSGATEQFAEIAGRHYSHIVDPSTGVGLADRGLVTVVARRGMDADALATALSVMGRARGDIVAARHGARVWWGE